MDLGLGTHRVKCRVHKDFRLIVVAEKNIVYNKFPIPLINRLEKHFLTITTMLTPFQLQLSKSLDEWARDFVKVPSLRHQVHARFGIICVANITLRVLMNFIFPQHIVTF